jgi:hypothetical protein
MNRFSEVYWTKPLSKRPAEAESAVPLEQRMAESTKLLRGWAERVEQQISTNPGACLAAAVGVGFLLGWWLKRS